MSNHEMYGVPLGFYENIKPYLEGKESVTTAKELLALWQAALEFRNKYPEAQDAIAEWTVSVGSSSPLVNDNDVFEAIHARFGVLEAGIPSEQEAGWGKVSDEIKKLASSTKS